MADKDKTNNKGKEKPVADFKLTLEEFCTRRSQNDKRVELIGGFHAAEKAASHTNDTEANFNKRLAEFAKKPVN